ncbi:MAG: hypothetical protein ACQESR_21125 [Planctomycetota bacterium]
MAIRPWAARSGLEWFSGRAGRGARCPLLKCQLEKAMIVGWATLAMPGETGQTHHFWPPVA